MNIRAFSLTLVLVHVLLAAFASLNWVALAAPTTLGIGFAEISAPPGLVLLTFTALISGLFIVYIVLLQAGVILEARRLTKEAHAQRELAQTAEASRITALQAFLESELRQLGTQTAASQRESGERIDRSGRALQDSLADATGTVSALLGEIEDKLDRVLAPTLAAPQVRAPA